ncbi:MAG TPA: hypothetical protein VG963_21165 [Polyangiaceae bacterium]|nr:hypothetical protein [Polyangiaceae bacterium]
MNCWSDEQLLAGLLGELSVNQASELERHRTVCSRCRALWRAHEQLLADLRAAPPLSRAQDEFVAQVLARCEESPPQRADPALGAPAQEAPARPMMGPDRLSSTTRRWAWSLALAAALGLCVVAPWRAHEPPGDAGARIAARGAQGRATSAPRTQRTPSAELWFVRDGVFAPLVGARLRAGDGLAVRCSNPDGEPVRLAVFALDAQSEVHWIYPAYVDPDSNPESISIAPRVLDRMLGEVVEPDAPAVGPFRVFAVFSRAPIAVRTVEAHRRELSAAELPAFLAGAHVQQWSVEWTER